MKVVLSTSPHVSHPAVLKADFGVNQSQMINFMPTGLLSLISSASKLTDTDFELFDIGRRVSSGSIVLGQDFYVGVASSICDLNPDVVGFMTESESYHHVLHICGELRRRNPDCVVVLGGPHASAVAIATMQKHPCIDHVVQGEGEQSFPDLLAAIKTDKYPIVDGVVSRNRNGSVMTPKLRPQIQSLDDLPYPAYHLYEPAPEEEIFFEVGRGCPFTCTFCSTAPFWKRQHRVKSPERIVTELVHVIGLYGKRRMHFTHDLLTTDRRWVKSLCESLIAAGSPVAWTCSSRTDTVDKQLLQLMSNAGCDAIYFGLESGSERVLRQIKKHIPLSTSFAIIRDCIDAGITPNVGFIGGLPGEDHVSFQETFEAFETCLRMGCSPVHLFAYTPYADSASYAKSGDFECTGHFLDLSLTPEVDIANRALVAEDRTLFGAFHRPTNPYIESDLLDGLEEFPSLVGSILGPTLRLSSLAGGMLPLFKRWINWVSNRNAKLNKQEYRAYYAGPDVYCSFLLELVDELDAPSYIASALQIYSASHELAATTDPAPTSMATFRSLSAPAELDEIELQTTLRVSNVEKMIVVDHDVSEMLETGRWDTEPQPGPMFLVWQRETNGQLRAIKINKFLYSTIETLGTSKVTAGEIIQNWILNEGGENEFHELLENIQNASRTDLISSTRPTA